MEKLEQTNLSQIRQAGFEILNKELGPVAMVRFLQQFESGQGNYTEERHQWLNELGIEEVSKEIEIIRTKRST